MLHDPGWDGCVIAFPELGSDEGGDQDTEEDEEGDDAWARPCIFRATPLQGEEDTDDSGDEDSGSDRIHRLEFLLPGPLRLGLALGRLEKDGDDENGDGADWEVDVKAPSPTDMVGEGSTQKRAGNRSDAVHGADDTRVNGSFDEWDSVRDDDQSAGKNASGSHTGNRSTDDQGLRTRCSAADDRADLEDEDGNQIAPLEREESVKFAPKKSKCATGQKVRTAIPPYVLQAVENI